MHDVLWLLMDLTSIIPIRTYQEKIMLNVVISG